jgi:hypothetical protein
VWGIDMSIYQDNNATPEPPDFQMLEQQGASFVIMRGTFGTAQDADYQRNVELAKKTNLATACYLFPDHRYVSAKSKSAQLQEVIKTLRFAKLDMPAKIDIESLRLNGSTYFPSRTVALDFYKDFYEAVKTETGKAADTYINPSTMRILNPMPSWMLEGDLWVAHWNVSTPNMKYSEWEKWRLWQCGVYAVGAKLGMESINVDINVYNGTRNDFDIYLGKDIIIQPDPVGGLQEQINQLAINDERQQQQINDIISTLIENGQNQLADLEGI